MAKRGDQWWSTALNGVLGSATEALRAKATATTEGARRVGDQLGQWFGHLSRNAVTQWPSTLLLGGQCSFCAESAISRCIGCGDPCCLAHAHVSFRAELLCDECVQVVLKTPLSRAPAGGGGVVREALAFFHLTPGATLEEVTAVYRARAREAHPDSGGTEAAMKEVGRMYGILKDHYEKRAA